MSDPAACDGGAQRCRHEVLPGQIIECLRAFPCCCYLVGHWRKIARQIAVGNMYREILKLS